MQIVIDIPEDIRVAISQMGLLRIPNEMQKKVDKAIQHGTPIPDNATNGEVVKLIFDEEDIWDIHTALNLYDDTRKWWNTLYSNED